MVKSDFQSNNRSLNSLSKPLLLRFRDLALICRDSPILYSLLYFLDDGFSFFWVNHVIFAGIKENV